MTDELNPEERDALIRALETKGALPARKSPPHFGEVHDDLWEIINNRWRLTPAGTILAQSLKREREGRAWRPIETAPKDGTEVMLFIAEPGNFEGARTMMVARWRDGFWRELHHDEERCFYWDSFTHWMPPPPEPKR